MYDITLPDVWQEGLSWGQRKKAAQDMALVMGWAGYRQREERMAHCGDYLYFARYEDEKRELIRAELCRDRLCPNCAYLRSRKVFGQVCRVMNAMPDKLAYLFLTLTVKNCRAEDFDKTLDNMFHGWQNLIRRNAFKPVKGWFRALEVTYNAARNDYHPHFHVILAVPPSYFSHGYVSHARWVQLWKDCAGLDYAPSVDVRRVKPDQAGSLIGAVKEVAKYTVDLSKMLKSEDLSELVTPIETLAIGLKGRRLVGFGGLMKKLHKELDLTDPVDGELVEPELRPDVAYVVERYRWGIGADWTWYKLDEQTREQYEAARRLTPPSKVEGDDSS